MQQSEKNAELESVAILLGLGITSELTRGAVVDKLDRLIAENDSLRKGELERPAGDLVLWVQSGVNKKGDAFVQLLRNDQVVAQLGVDQAREVAGNMLQVAESALTDSLLIRMLEPVQTGAGAALVMQLRGEREKAGIKGPPVSPADFLRTPQHEAPPKPGEAKITFPRTHDDA